MSEPTAGVDAPAPATPDPATIASLADYEAARPQLLKDSATPPERGESADTIRERLLTEQDTRVQRDQRGRFTKAAEAAPALQDVPEKAADATATTTPEPAPPQTTRKNPQDRIAHVVWEREQARREAAALRAQLEALQAPAPMAAAPAAPEPPAMDPPPSSKPAPDYGDPRDPQPSEDQFQTYAEFVNAQARWAARQEYRDLLLMQQAQQQAQHAAQMRDMRASAFAERMQAAEQAEPALLTTIAPEVLELRPAMSLQPGERPTGATAIADALLESEQPQRLMRYLSDHTDDLRRITALHPMLAMREIGRLEARLDAASLGSVSQPTTRSQAKPPIQPVGSGAAMPTGARDPKDISSLAEWEAVRRSFGAR